MLLCTAGVLGILQEHEVLSGRSESFLRNGPFSWLAGQVMFMFDRYIDAILSELHTSY